MLDGSYPPGVEGWMIDDGTDQCCATCKHYNGDYCTKEWDDNDPDCCIPERDEKAEDDYCDDWEES